MLPIRTVLHPTDLSEESRSAFLYACALARDYGARLILLSVYPSSGWYEKANESNRPHESPEELLAKLQQLKPDPRLEVIYRVAEGKPEEMILAVAEEFNANLIVMATYGQSSSRHQVMGSVTEAVNRGAFCPVMAIRGQVKFIPEPQSVT